MWLINIKAVIVVKVNRIVVDFLTVLFGLMLAFLRANWMACSDGLQITGVVGRSAVGSGWAKCCMMSKICEHFRAVFGVESVSFEPFFSSSSYTLPFSMGFRLSKHIIPSKQSSNPSLFSALIVWTLSEFVKIYSQKQTIH